MKHQGNVTAGNIYEGDIGRPSSCPIALMGKKLFDKLVRVYPGYVGVYEKDGGPDIYHNGPRLIEWIDKYDNGEPVDCITIEFDHEKLTAEVV